MTELKLSEIKGLLGEKTLVSKYDHYCNNEICGACYDEDINRHIDELGTKNLLDYVEAVVCRDCGGKGWVTENEKPYSIIRCENCLGTGAVIRVKEGR